MSMKKNIEESLMDYDVTEINGQPTDEDVNNLMHNFTAMAISIHTSLGGREHGHIGMLLDGSDCIAFSNG